MAKIDLDIFITHDDIRSRAEFAFKRTICGQLSLTKEMGLNTCNAVCSIQVWVVIAETQSATVNLTEELNF